MIYRIMGEGFTRLGNSKPPVTEKPTLARARTHKSYISSIPGTRYPTGREFSQRIFPTVSDALLFLNLGRTFLGICYFLRLLSLLDAPVLPGATVSIWSKIGTQQSEVGDGGVWG